MNDLTETAATVIERQNDPVEPSAPAVLVEEELLVEEVSIDGMCGVY